ncbi:hypothetical protein ABIF90_000649 [Bradyrhizobium japonicum]
MKHTAERPYADPEASARKLLETQHCGRGRQQPDIVLWYNDLRDMEGIWSLVERPGGKGLFKGFDAEEE